MRAVDDANRPRELLLRETSADAKVSDTPADLCRSRTRSIAVEPTRQNQMVGSQRVTASAAVVVRGSELAKPTSRIRADDDVCILFIEWVQGNLSERSIGRKTAELNAIRTLTLEAACIGMSVDRKCPTSIRILRTLHPPFGGFARSQAVLFASMKQRHLHSNTPVTLRSDG